MTAVQIFFLIIAAATLGSALMVVTVRNMIQSALWLVAALFGVAVMYVLLNAGFLAVVQVVIYIGAIAILIIFAVMMTRRLMNDPGPQTNPSWWLAALLSLTFLGGLTWMYSRWSGFWVSAPEFPAGTDPLTTLGQALVSTNGYVLPFELASVLLLAAMVGAIMVAWDRRGR